MRFTRIFKEGTGYGIQMPDGDIHPVLEKGYLPSDCFLVVYGPESYPCHQEAQETVEKRDGETCRNEILETCSILMIGQAVSYRTSKPYRCFESEVGGATALCIIVEETSHIFSNPVRVNDYIEALTSSVLEVSDSPETTMSSDTVVLQFAIRLQNAIIRIVAALERRLAGVDLDRFKFMLYETSGLIASMLSNPDKGKEISNRKSTDDKNEKETIERSGMDHVYRSALERILNILMAIRSDMENDFSSISCVLR